MADIEKTATQMAKELQQSDEFKGLKEAYDSIKANQEAYDSFKDFQEIQLTIQQKQMQGEKLSDEEMKHAQEIAEKVGKIDEIKALMDHEKEVNDLLTKLNQAITKPIQELYRN
ncbi:YlbF family regulator [Secundilactobacillus malefermentans]|uniref:UPF0342 protein C5L31_000659 n=1 Tax=Secundilactobacillus malefermentans TaxID=176292 RepID=A0A4R5NLN4_9LACO|nr:YlbF family regulator [Secundilactobacillus malefermentans]KRM58446.1 hypothetical protein FD44_GL000704 [Secundilactobacillus malefermentans DSM 5705 = KCTC 3548]QEA30752.1 hypothetical protein FGL90_00345 [Secundilactobacillus malefermentans]TDG75883.1 hypothetical protein C5L31_000659 [Secundilactobacillus malefermentans]